MSTLAPHRRTLWEEGREPGRLVVAAAAVVVLLVVLVDVASFGQVNLLFDVVFVLVCVASALAVRPSDFYAVVVLPPVLLVATMAVLAIVARESIARVSDGLLQAVVSGLAHHAAGLFAGYALALVLLALRQVARRHAGRLRAPPGADRG